MRITYNQVIQHTTPEEYFRKLKTPHEVINNSVSPQPEKDFQILNNILNKSYNDKEITKKEQVLQQLKTIIKQWMNGLMADIPKRCGLEIFGSYQLGASSYDSDIDAVCIVPMSVTREKNFFGELVALLESNPNMQQVFPIPTAAVPLIRIKFYCIYFDILMSQINTNMLQLSTQAFFGSDVLDIIPDRELKSINGCRVAYYLKQNIKRYDYFQLALKAVKMWAKNKGVYSQIFCYLGGIGYTIMLAKISQLYPNYSPLKLLDRFFFIYSRWVWDIPVFLENIPVVDDKLGQRPEMSVMTPVSPSMNAAHSVSKSTLRIMRRQFIQASRVIQKIYNNTKTWNDLFAPSNFFERYKCFLELSIMAKNNRYFTNWKGHIQSKFRKLIKLLESVENSCLIEINPSPKEFISKHNSYSLCSKYFFGINCRKYNVDDDTKQIDFSQATRSFLQLIETYNQIDKCPQEINIGLACIAKCSISKEIINSKSYYAFQ